MRLLVPFFLLVGLMAGCVVDEELPDEAREVFPSMKTAELVVYPNGSGELDFTFHYEMGIRDLEGVEQIDWNYRLVDRDEAVYATHDQRMRAPDLDKTLILVRGDRKRHLDVEGGLEAGRTYVIWFTLYYRDEILKEFLAPVEAVAAAR